MHTNTIAVECYKIHVVLKASFVASFWIFWIFRQKGIVAVIFRSHISANPILAKIENQQVNRISDTQRKWCISAHTNTKTMMKCKALHWNNIKTSSDLTHSSHRQSRLRLILSKLFRKRQSFLRQSWESEVGAMWPVRWPMSALHLMSSWIQVT